ncbi:MAG: GNAT family N-acetyltransferase [Caldilineaceae bacterium]
MTPAALDAVDPEALTAVWNACGEALSISPRAMAYNLAPSTDVAQHLVVASTDEGLAGFILVSKMDNPQVMPAHVGWCDALAVIPQQQLRIGSALLAQGEAAAHQGCTHSLWAAASARLSPACRRSWRTRTFSGARLLLPAGR